jgi:hypothetical protein
MTIASPRHPNGPAQREPFGFIRLWTWISRCEMEGCDARPVHLGWCAAHAPAYDPPPDEYWGDGDGADDAELDQR